MSKCRFDRVGGCGTIYSAYRIRVLSVDRGRGGRCGTYTLGVRYERRRYPFKGYYGDRVRFMRVWTHIKVRWEGRRRKEGGGVLS